jgi:hypothetical protein
MIAAVAYEQSFAYIPELHGTNCITLYYVIRVKGINP